MYKICPKCGHTAKSVKEKVPVQCPQCGLVYQKWFKHRFRFDLQDDENEIESRGIVSAHRLRELFLYVKPETASAAFFARCFVYAGLLIWGWQFIQMDYYYYVNGIRIDAATPEIYDSILHNVNLLFHEAGHVVFRPFGRFMTILGGSLLQILMPLVVMLVFLLKERNTFGAAVGLWWTGQNFMDVAPYINDARAGQIPLLGGGNGTDHPAIHDWHNLLSDAGMLEYDHAIAAFVNGIGILLMLLSLLWGAKVLHQQYKNL
jgi:hypothetical protein